jgi:hypothetical protein
LILFLKAASGQRFFMLYVNMYGLMEQQKAAKNCLHKKRLKNYTLIIYMLFNSRICQKALQQACLPPV